MKLNNIVRSVKMAGHRSMFKMHKHSAEITIGLSIFAGLAATGTASYATIKAIDLINETKETIAKIDAVKEQKREDYTEEDAQHDTAITFAKTGASMVKLYAVPVMLSVCSVGLALKSNSISRHRNAALATALATTSSCFAAYRDGVITRFGEAVDNELRYGLITKEMESTIIDPETGTSKVEKTEVVISDPNLKSPYAFYYDGNNRNFGGYDHNMYYLRAQMSYATDKLRSQGHLFLNEVYDMLDMPRTSIGQLAGWVYDPKHPDEHDNYVDFRILPVYREIENGVMEEAIVIDPNVEGNILDLI